MSRALAAVRRTEWFEPQKIAAHLDKGALAAPQKAEARRGEKMGSDNCGWRRMLQLGATVFVLGFIVILVALMTLA